jgi:hypothetical protein
MDDVTRSPAQLTDPSRHARVHEWHEQRVCRLSRSCKMRDRVQPTRELRSFDLALETFAAALSAAKSGKAASRVLSAIQQEPWIHGVWSAERHSVSCRFRYSRTNH